MLLHFTIPLVLRQALCFGCHGWLVHPCFVEGAVMEDTRPALIAGNRHWLASSQWHPTRTLYMNALTVIICFLSFFSQSLSGNELSNVPLSRSLAANDENSSPSPQKQQTIEQTLQLKYLSRKLIPNFEIENQPARIHTQGLWVTKEHFFVTGRLERSPRRALFLRFERNDLNKVEYVDITPAFGSSDNKVTLLDHPGGFDFDGRSFWIPVAISKPGSKSIILKFP